MHQYDIRDLRIHFPTRRGVVEAVRGVSFYMDQGECVALVGESGCGKSVTARSLMGLTEVTGGRCQPGSQILCHGENILDYSKKQWQSYRGRDAAMIFQDAMTSLNPTMQIGHQIASATASIRRSAARRRWRRRRRCWRWWASLTRRRPCAAIPTSSPAVCASV